MTRFKPFAALALAAGLALTGAAQANSLLDASMYPALIGTNAGSVDGVSFASTGGDFATKISPTTCSAASPRCPSPAPTH